MIGINGLPVYFDDQTKRVFEQLQLVRTTKTIEYEYLHRDEIMKIVKGSVGIVVEDSPYGLTVCFEVGSNDTDTINVDFSEIEEV